MRITLNQDLDHLHKDIIDMSTLVEHSIEDTIQALKKQDVELARSIMKGDDAVDAAEGQIEQLCLKIITRYQPVAGDLRQVSAALKVITDLERISDHCSDISEIVLLLVGQTLVKPLYHIPLMADTTRQMVRDAISAYIQADETMARDVMGRDDEVDGLFSKVVLELTQIISEKPAYASQAIDLIFIAKYLERMADHATNIAEWAVFLATGHHPIHTEEKTQR